MGITIPLNWTISGIDKKVHLIEIPGLAIGTPKYNGKNKLVTCFFIRQNAYEFYII